VSGVNTPQPTTRPCRCRLVRVLMMPTSAGCTDLLHRGLRRGAPLSTSTAYPRAWSAVLPLMLPGNNIKSLRAVVPSSNGERNPRSRRAKRYSGASPPREMLAIGCTSKPDLGKPRQPRLSGVQTAFPIQLVILSQAFPESVSTATWAGEWPNSSSTASA